MNGRNFYLKLSLPGLLGYFREVWKLLRGKLNTILKKTFGKQSKVEFISLATKRLSPTCSSFSKCFRFFSLTYIHIRKYIKTRFCHLFRILKHRSEVSITQTNKTTKRVYNIILTPWIFGIFFFSIYFDHSVRMFLWRFLLVSSNNSTQFERNFKFFNI